MAGGAAWQGATRERAERERSERQQRRTVEDGGGELQHALLLLSHGRLDCRPLERLAALERADATLSGVLSITQHVLLSLVACWMFYTAFLLVRGRVAALMLILALWNCPHASRRAITHGIS